MNIVIYLFFFQNVGSIGELPTVQHDHTFEQEVEIQSKYFKAWR
jgi:hypothetical protein